VREALGIARLLPREVPRSWSPLLAVKAAVEVGAASEAQPVAEAFEDPFLKCRTLALVASATKGTKPLEDSLELGKTIEDSYWRAEALAHLARQAEKAGQPDIARQVARAVPAFAVEQHSAALSAAARAMARANRFYEARQLAKECLPKDELDAYATILEAYDRYRGY
jgi:hypothetical protein